MYQIDAFYATTLTVKKVSNCQTQRINVNNAEGKQLSNWSETSTLISKDHLKSQLPEVVQSLTKLMRIDAKKQRRITVARNTGS